MVSGYRITLTYNLLLHGDTSRPAGDEGAVAELADLLRAHFRTPVPRYYGGPAADPPNRLVYLLDHEYTARGLSWQRLKGADASRAALLRKYDVQDLIDSEVTLTHWTGPAGTRLEETALYVDGNEVCASTPTGDLSTRPALRAPCRLHQFDARTFDLERELLDVGARRPLGLYTVERSILDAIRLRHREGSDLAWQALRRWLNQPGASPARLTELAQRFPHAEPALRQALAVLL